MLTYTLDEKNDRAGGGFSAGSTFAAIRTKTLYEQLYEKIRDDILSGTLAASTRLPSKRELARNEAVSVITVENAYAKLVDEGYVTALPKKGFFVADISVDERLKKPAFARVHEQTSLAGRAAATDSGAASDCISLCGTGFNEALFPFATWSRLARRVLSEQRTDCMQSSPANGIHALREAIARHLYGFRGLSVRPEQIVVGAGTEYLYSLILQLLGFENVFAIEDPGYAKIARIYEACSVRAVPVPVEEQGISIDALKASGANIAHISPSHHFPTGRTTTISRRYELLSWASAGDSRYIIEDDYDAEFRLTGRVIPTLASIDTIDRVIYLNTFTKTLSPALRISYMVLPLSLLEQFKQRLGFYASTVPTMHQLTLALFMQDGHFESHINSLRRYYRDRRDAAVAALRRFPALADAEVLEADAGVYFLLRVPTEKSDAELKAACAREGVEISCLSDFYVGQGAVARNKETAHTLLVYYASLGEDKLEEAFTRLSRAVEE